ncbi:MAG: pyridoxal phosphate-dependent aminotransferase [Myxococcota bacterium]
MTPEVSLRGRQMPASPIRKLAPLADEAKRRGTHVIHLNIGQPDLETPEPMRRRLASLKDKVLAYSPSGGTPEYLGSLVEYYRRLGIVLHLNQLVATTGGSEAVQFAFFACTNPGDEILVVEPFYTNYRAFATVAGVKLVPLLSRGEDGFHLPPQAQFEAALTPHTRAVLLCNPNNPTGTVYRRDELERVAAFCKTHGLFLISDEVYREFVYDGRELVSALTLPEMDEHVIVVDSLSKRYSACGIRLGALVTRNAEVYSVVMRLAQGRLSPPGLAQLVALGATELDERYTQSVVTEYQHRRDLLYAGLREIPGVFLQQPEGAFYFIARLPVDDSEDFARWLLEQFSFDGATVMVAPAPGFYASEGLGMSEVRIAYVLEAAELSRAVAVLRAALEQYRQVRGLPPVGAGVVRTDFHTPDNS